MIVCVCADNSKTTVIFIHSVYFSIPILLLAYTALVVEASTCLMVQMEKFHRLYMQETVLSYILIS